MTTPISIIIPAFNQLEYCRQCIYSIEVNTERAHKLILVDNGSTDGVSEYFDSVPGTTVVHSATNTGFAGGVNLGLAHAEGHVVLLNSDTLVPKGWLGRLERVLIQDERIGMIGPMSNYVSGPQQIEGLDLKSLDAVSAYADTLACEKGESVTEALRLVGFCLMIRDSVVAEVGTFDESFGIGNFEDDDYCLRVSRAGYRLCVAEGSFVFHYGNRTFAGMKVDEGQWDALMDRNRCVFEEKWGLRPDKRFHPAVHSQKLNAQARQAFEDGDLEKARGLLEQAIELYPKLAANFNDLGVIQYTEKQMDEAFESFVEALRLKPDYPEARDNLRDLAEALGRQEEASRVLGTIE